MVAFLYIRAKQNLSAFRHLEVYPDNTTFEIDIKSNLESSFLKSDGR